MSRDAASPTEGARDALTFAGFGVLAMWAWFLYGFGPMLPLLRIEQGTSRTVTGLHSLLMSAGAILAAFLAVPIVRVLRRRGAITLGVCLVAAGVVGLAVAPGPWASLPAVLVSGIGGSITINAINASLAAHHGAAGASILSEGNAVAAAVGLVAPLAVGAGAAAGATWRPALLLVVPLAVVSLFLVRRIPAGWPAIDGGDGDHGGQGRLNRAFWCCLAMITATVGIEFCCTAWSADLLAQRTGLSASSASASVTVFVAGMFVGRIAGGPLARRHPSPAILAVALVVIAAGWALLWTATSPLPGLAGLGLIGLGQSVQYPLAAAIAYAAAPGAGDKASAALSFSVGSAAALSPFLIGAVADRSSTHAAFVALPVLTVVAGAFLVALVGLPGRRSKQPVPSGEPA